MQIVGANPNGRAVRHGGLETKVNYFLGNDPNQWHTNVPTFAKAQYDDVYPGIDLVYYGNGGQLEYDFVVSPHADPNQIQLTFTGAASVEIDTNGDLVLSDATDNGSAIGGTTDNFELRQQKPYIYQEVNGTRQQVAGSFRLSSSPLTPGPSPLVSFDVGAYDPSRPLVIDPLVLGYSTYLGAGGAHDFVYEVAVDDEGYAYVTGETPSAKFPTTAAAFDESFNGGSDDAFVAKLNEDGSALIYAKYIGGADGDRAGAIALDAGGNVYVSGSTRSRNFPTTPGALDTSYNRTGDVFVTKLNADGSALAYSTYLGGAGSDGANDIAVDPSGAAYLIGGTSSMNFPVTAGAFDVSFGGSPGDAFAAKLSSDGSALIYGSYLGGSENEDGMGIAIDGDGNAYLTGDTQSADFPTENAFDPTYHGDTDAFVAKLNADASELLYSTYLGGEKSDGGNGIAVDDTGNAFVAGTTLSVDFPVTPGAFDTTHLPSDVSDGFVTRLAMDGGTLQYSTYLSGGSNSAHAIELDISGNAYVTGSASFDFATTPDAFDQTYNGGEDAYLLVLNAPGSGLVYSSYLGGFNTDRGWAIAVETPGSVYIAGETRSSNFPTTPNAFKRRNRENSTDGFVTKFAAL